MGAVFEISIISTSFIPPEVSAHYLSCLGPTFSPERLECIQSWDWHGHRVLPLLTSADDLEPLVTTGETVLLCGKLNVSNAGVFISQNTDMTFQTDLWFDDSLYPQLPIFVAAHGCAGSFQALEDHLQKLLSLFSQYSPVLAVMGEEIVFEYSPDLNECRRHSRVDRWIEFV